jgi:ribosomal protein S18 acetylase RimI-like enzyme
MPDNNKAFATKSIAENSAAIVSFKRANSHDRAFLLTLRKASMDEHLKTAGIYLDDSAHMQRIDEYFNDSHIISFQNSAIGLIKLALFTDKIHIRQFQLLPRYQGLGIGSKVLELVKRKAQEKQLAITLNVLLNNPAKQLYLRHGFVIIDSNELEFQMRWQRRA